MTRPTFKIITAPNKNAALIAFKASYIYAAVSDLELSKAVPVLYAMTMEMCSDEGGDATRDIPIVGDIMHHANAISHAPDTGAKLIPVDVDGKDITAVKSALYDHGFLVKHNELSNVFVWDKGVCGSDMLNNDDLDNIRLLMLPVASDKKVKAFNGVVARKTAIKDLKVMQSDKAVIDNRSKITVIDELHAANASKLSGLIKMAKSRYAAYARILPIFNNEDAINKIHDSCVEISGGADVTPIVLSKVITSLIKMLEFYKSGAGVSGGDNVVKLFDALGISDNGIFVPPDALYEKLKDYGFSEAVETHAPMADAAPAHAPTHAPVATPIAETSTDVTGEAPVVSAPKRSKLALATAIACAPLDLAGGVAIGFKNIFADEDGLKGMTRHNRRDYLAAERLYMKWMFPDSYLAMLEPLMGYKNVNRANRAIFNNHLLMFGFDLSVGGTVLLWHVATFLHANTDNNLLPAEVVRSHNAAIGKKHHRSDEEYMRMAGSPFGCSAVNQQRYINLIESEHELCLQQHVDDDDGFIPFTSLDLLRSPFNPRNSGSAIDKAKVVCPIKEGAPAYVKFADVLNLERAEQPSVAADTPHTNTGGDGDNDAAHVADVTDIIQYANANRQ